MKFKSFLFVREEIVKRNFFYSNASESSLSQGEKENLL